MSGAGGYLEPDRLVSRLRAAGCVFAEDEARILRAAARDPDELAVLTARRVAGVPLEQVVGWVEFAGMSLVVRPGVFVPRRRTQFLVAVAAESVGPGAIVVDLCCGTGALGLALVASRSDLHELHAVDIDPAAVECARINLGGRGTAYRGDLFDPIPVELRERVGIVLANVPYVPTDEIGMLPAEAREHEPRVSLDGGADGLDLVRRVAAAAPAWLVPGGSVLFEVAVPQIEPALAVLRQAGLAGRVECAEELGATVVAGSRAVVPQ
ncbi:putative protein N(5)-glutamine methyltransferase [Skermania piniformis]|uniref:peptide chain release factor N(5)-glutamine methyltransferase n=1 Tax=Skermania pinensis TaxID=39122 RepID=A0ABX8SEQ3_9ACTN|nr:putative protein N(5)-glutamine methyltransferase [Skermania piniformis]QXQ15439.1 putative protein N(5)-glutamine methyltransferase [Skermania piniformis]